MRYLRKMTKNALALFLSIWYATHIVISDYKGVLIMSIFTLIAAIIVGILSVVGLIVFSKMILGSPKPISNRVARLQAEQRKRR
jgi:hypothetical protein